MNRLVDKVYLINMDQAHSRFYKAKELFANENFAVERFSASNGYNVKILDLERSRSFFGKDIKDEKEAILKNKKYKIICNPNDNEPVEFIFKGFLRNSGDFVSAGELGIWCSTQRIFKDASKNNYQRIIILEDDVIPHKNFVSNLQNFLNKLPSDSDIGYLKITFSPQNKGNPTYIVNEKILGFNENIAGWGGYGYMITLPAIKKIMSFKEYFYPLDIFYWCLSTGTTNMKYHPQSKECSPYIGFLKTYVSAVTLLDEERIIDEHGIHMMGRKGAPVEPSSKEIIYLIRSDSIETKNYKILKDQNISYKIIYSYYDSDFNLLHILDKVKKEICINKFKKVFLIKDEIELDSNSITKLKEMSSSSENVEYFTSNLNISASGEFGILLDEIAISNLCF